MVKGIHRCPVRFIPGLDIRATAALGPPPVPQQPLELSLPGGRAFRCLRSISGASGGAFNVVGRYCDSRSICGWEIYGDLRRHIYYLRNQCECPPTTRCVRVEDDVLQEAYIYKCRRIISSPYV
ncbi:hypothetical protein O3P69_020691 [Scylla paramamosain]|uniref:Uncharacterized protein n=1 Tax=Scylla paramamosain TaxID=85552 RepID=A0AAW0TMC5_SCYPA